MPEPAPRRVPNTERMGNAFPDNRHQPLDRSAALKFSALPPLHLLRQPPSSAALTERRRAGTDGSVPHLHVHRLPTLETLGEFYQALHGLLISSCVYVGLHCNRREWMYLDRQSYTNPIHKNSFDNLHVVFMVCL
jgi:hypothetical protein